MSWTRSRFFPGLRQCQRTSQRLSGLGVVLGLLTFLAVSGPHRVHHLVELSTPGTHHSHHSQAPELPDCPIFSLTQHTPVAVHCLRFLVAPLSVVERLFLQPPGRLPTHFWYRSQTRSPPAWFVFGLLPH
jgi:hypothetical protein